MSESMSVADLALLHFSMDCMRDAVYLTDGHARLLYVNEEACRVLGVDRERLLSMAVSDFEPEWSTEQWQLQWQRLEREGYLAFESRLRRHDGRLVPVEITVRPFLHRGCACALFVAHDLSERRAAEQRVQRLTALNRAMSEISQAIVRMEQQSELLPLVCRCAVEFGGMSLAWVGQLDEATGQILPVAMHGDRLDYLDGIRVSISADDPFGRGPAGTAIRESRWVVVNDYDNAPNTAPWQQRRTGTGWHSGAAFPILRGGAPFAVLAVYHPEVGAFDDAAVALLDEMCKDISFALDNFDREVQRKKGEETIWRQANFDGLTGLPNRHRFQDRLLQEIRASQASGLPFALMFMDLDHFKEVNDTLGHAVGDLLLVQAAQRVQACVHASDMVARFGGDEFMIILGAGTYGTRVDEVCQEVLRVVAEPFVLGTERVYVSASLGVTVYPDDADTPESLLRNADQAMYAAKNAGRNRFSYFTTSMQALAMRRVRLANELRNALDAGQLTLVYQPIVDLGSGALVGAEALLRWHHPVLGPVSPAEFIPIAESTGLILAIGDWVFRTAMARAVDWQQRCGQAIHISVNVSPVQVQDARDWLAQWAALVAAAGLPSRSLVIEITEGLLLHANAESRARLGQARRNGICISLDDFGTGYSSLSYLREFEIDHIKIDKSFVTRLTDGSGDLALCEAMIAMAHKLGIGVIAEGIENDFQRDQLAAAGCRRGQGFLFSAGLPWEELEQRFLAPLPPAAESRTDFSDPAVQGSATGVR